MAAQSFSFSAKSDADAMFVTALKIQEARIGRANFSWIVMDALRDYAAKVAKERANGTQD